MKAIIMAAGRGKRLGDLTKDIPKPLLQIGGKPILQHLFESLPAEIEEVIVVVGYRGDQIKKYFGNNFGVVKIKYAEQSEMAGTAGALWSAKPYIGPGSFLVISGDDFYSAEDLKLFTKNKLAIALYPSETDENFYGVKLDANNNLQDFDKESGGKNRLVVTGAYMLDQRIFAYDPAILKNGEFGLPQTILKLAGDYPVQGVTMGHWWSCNTPEDFKNIARVFESHE